MTMLAAAIGPVVRQANTLETALYIVIALATLTVLAAGLRAYYRKNLGEALDAKAQRRIDGYKADNDLLAGTVAHLRDEVRDNQASLVVADGQIAAQKMQIEALKLENESFRTLNGSEAWERLEHVLSAQHREIMSVLRSLSGSLPTKGTP